MNYKKLICEKIDEEIETALKFGLESVETQRVAEKNDKILDRLFRWATVDYGRMSEKSLVGRKDKRHSKGD